MCLSRPGSFLCQFALDQFGWFMKQLIYVKFTMDQICLISVYVLWLGLVGFQQGFEGFMQSRRAERKDCRCVLLSLAQSFTFSLISFLRRMGMCVCQVNSVLFTVLSHFKNNKLAVIVRTIFCHFSRFLLPTHTHTIHTLIDTTIYLRESFINTRHSWQLE